MRAGDINEDDEVKPKEPQIECSMCHQKVFVSQTAIMGGRRLCFGCAAAWFEDEDEEREE